MLYMLDTNAASEAIRGNPLFDARLQALAPGQWCVGAVTCSELRYGIARRPEAVRLARLVEAFLCTSPPSCPGTPGRPTSMVSYGQLRAYLRAQGSPIGDFDEMIAAHALALDAILVTDNVRHFERIPGLRIENWLRQGH